MNITQNMYNVLLQQQRILHIKVNLLNFQFLTVNELSGLVLNPPQIDINANSDIRRTCDIEMVVKERLYDIEVGGQIFIDKFVQVYFGIEDIRNSNEIVWFNQGIYLINAPSVQYNATTNTLSFQGVDLMAKLTGMRNGYLEGIPSVIPKDSVIRDVIISTLALGGFNKYIINIKDTDTKTPYEIKLDIGATVYDILAKLKEIYSAYQMYFDIDGVFHYEPYPTDENAPILIDNSMWDRLYISHTNAVDFEQVKNVVEVLGKSYDIQHYGATTTVSGSEYTTNIASLSALSNDILIGFTAPSVVVNPTLKINNFTAYPIVNEDGTSAVIPEANKYYVVQYKDSKYIFMGYQQVRATAKDENPDSPFYVNGTTGEIRIVLSGGEFDNIPSNKLALDRAKYEIYMRSRVNDSLIIETIPIYFADVYQLISFKFPDDVETYLYMIQSISTSDTQTITCSRFYPLYPFS